MLALALSRSLLEGLAYLVLLVVILSNTSYQLLTMLNERAILLLAMHNKQTSKKRTSMHTTVLAWLGATTSAS